MIRNHNFHKKQPMSYKIYLINLARSGARLKSMSQKFEGMGLQFERIEAVDGRSLSEKERADFARRRPRLGEWLPGAIGCFLSHYEAWTRIAVGEEEFGVIFEDDLHISAKFPALLNTVGGFLDNKIDIARLEATKHLVLLDHNDYVTAGDIQLIRVKSEVWCTGAYIISKKVAKMLLQVPEKDHMPSDYFLFDRNTSKLARQLRVFQAVPALCVQSKFDPEQAKQEATYVSNIEHNSDAGTLKYYFRELGWRIRGFRNLLLGYRRICLSDDIVRL
jgi:glycosyl transferase family 25